MRKNATIFLLSLLIFLAGIPILARAETLNAGFVNGIWYSALPLVGGNQVRIYTAVQNHSGFELIGKVKFFDGEALIGQTDFSATNGSLAQSWIDWKVTEGPHRISAKITDAKKCEIGKEPVAIDFASASPVDIQYAAPEPPKPVASNPENSAQDGSETKRWWSSLFGSSNETGEANGAPSVSGTATGSPASKTDEGFFASIAKKLEAEKARVEQEILKAEETEQKKKEKAPAETSDGISATGSSGGVIEDIRPASLDKAYAGLLGIVIFILKSRLLLFTIGLAAAWILWKIIKFRFLT